MNGAKQTRPEDHDLNNGDDSRKRRKQEDPSWEHCIAPTHLTKDFGLLAPCRQVDQCYERLNRIDEGTYGIVYRARDRLTGDIVALKHLKLDQE
ncbi:hypothetical protein GGI13_001488, partial [Coemansia sp. RSA 455]